MAPTELRATSELFWKATLGVGIADVIFVALLAWRLRPERFRQMKWSLGAAATIIYGALWTWAMWSFTWELAYRYIFTEWSRYVVPPAYGLLFGCIGVGLWWLALRLPGKAVVNFCVLGGLVSLPGHLWAFHAFGMNKKVPLLQDASEISMLTFGVFEFIFYWGVIIILGLLLQHAWEHWRKPDSGGC